MGFLPDDTAWLKIIVPKAREKLRLLRLLGQIDQPTLDEVETILRQTDPRAIRDFLALDRTLVGAGPKGTTREVPLLSVLMLQPGTDWIGSFLFRDPTTEKLFDSFKETHDVDHPRPWR